MANNGYKIWCIILSKKSGRNFLIVVLLFIQFSCVSEVELSFSEADRVMVLNCILRPGQDTVAAWISYTRPVLLSEPFQPVAGANVILYENDEPAGQFQQSDSTAWILPYKIKPGEKYKLEVTSGNTSVWAETRVPQFVTAEIDSLQRYHYRLEYTISFYDNPVEKNFYWITATGYSWYNGLPYYEMSGSIHTDYSFADDFNRFTETFGGYIYSYEKYIRITDTSLPDAFIQVQFHPSNINISLGSQRIYVLSVDFHLDKYMKSSMQNQEIDLIAEDVPIVFAPFPVYSNIHGGTGIFGSYSSVSKEFSNNEKQ